MESSALVPKPLHKLHHNPISSLKSMASRSVPSISSVSFHSSMSFSPLSVTNRLVFPLVVVVRRRKDFCPVATNAASGASDSLQSGNGKGSVVIKAVLRDLCLLVGILGVVGLSTAFYFRCVFETVVRLLQPPADPLWKRWAPIVIGILSASILGAFDFSFLKAIVYPCLGLLPFEIKVGRFYRIDSVCGELIRKTFHGVVIRDKNDGDVVVKYDKFLAEAHDVTGWVVETFKVGEGYFDNAIATNQQVVQLLMNDDRVCHDPKPVCLIVKIGCSSAEIVVRFKLKPGVDFWDARDELLGKAYRLLVSN